MESKPGLGRVFQVYLVASYLYYIRHQSLLQDEQYDKMAKVLLKNWDQFEHPHKHLVSKEDLQAGTLYTLKAKDYPMVVRHCADLKMREQEEREQRREHGIE